MIGRDVLIAGVLGVGLVLGGSCASLAGDQPPADEITRQHAAWVLESLVRMETIKPGMTRAVLFKVFTEEGGLYSRTTGHYVLRDCPYFKVDVEFEPVGPGTIGRTVAEGSDSDIIKTISRPYIQRMILN